MSLKKLRSTFLERLSQASLLFSQQLITLMRVQLAIADLPNLQRFFARGGTISLIGGNQRCWEGEQICRHH